MILPLIVLIGGTFIGLFVTGGGNIINGSGTTAILYSVIVTLLFMAVLYTRQKIMTGKQFSDYLLKGVSNMINLVCLLFWPLPSVRWSSSWRQACSWPA